MKQLVEDLFNNKFEKYFRLYGILIFIFSISNYIFQNLAHMTTSNIMPGIAPHLDLGLPYKDYWDVYPPGIYLFYYLTFFIIYDNIIIYSFFHLFILISTIYFSYKIYEKLETPKIIYYLGLTYFLSPLYIDYLLPNDLIGLFFSFFGLYLYLYMESTKNRVIFSNFFLIFSFFIKETFFLSSFTVLIISLLNGKSSDIKNSIYGIFSSVLFVFAYLQTLSITEEVIKSYTEKYIIFNFEKILLNSIPLLIVSLSFLIYIFLNPKKILVKKFTNIIVQNDSIIYLYSILMLVSFFLIGKDDGGHFDIPKIFTTVFLLNILFKIKYPKIIISIIIFLATGFNLKLNHSIYSYTLIEPNISFNINSNIKDSLTETYEQLSESNGEVLYLYGWGSSDFYYELKVKPYSKYWILHPQITNENQINDLKKNLMIEPPKYIFYCGINDSCVVDFDYKEFENQYINFQNIVTSCYIEIEKNIFELTNEECLENINF